jgi:hypothetical protein
MAFPERGELDAAAGAENADGGNAEPGGEVQRPGINRDHEPGSFYYSQKDGQVACGREDCGLGN